MTAVGLVLVGVPLSLFVYAYLAYPALLASWAALRPRSPPPPEPAEWPPLSVSLPAHDEEDQIAGALDALLAAGYPAARLQVVVVSDASTDRTDEIVAGYADRGVELLRLPERAGKTAAENAAVARLRGEVVVNTDASTRVLPGSLRALVRALGDPEVGVASGRDVSVGAGASGGPAGETGYVGYEMWVRSLETRLGGIVGASGCCYAIRRELHEVSLPPALSRDFASALVARERGYRAVSVEDAVCLVPRAASLRIEFRRKVRTMARGLDTLWHHRRLMSPFRHGAFAWKLLSHKLARWLVPPTAPLALVGLALLAPVGPWALAALAAAGASLGLAALAYARSEAGRPPGPVGVLAYGVLGLVAGITAWTHALRGRRSAVWEPTRRRGATRTR